MGEIVPRAHRAKSSGAWSGDAPLRILVGPYHLPAHWQYMEGAFDDHEALSFGTGEGVDIPSRSVEPIDEILKRLPEGFEPDLLILWRPEYGAVPPGLESLPFPVVMLTSDWYLEFSDCVETARFVNCVVTGSRGERVFKAAGFDHVLNMPMLGYEPGVDGAHRAPERDIDVFYAGSTNWAAHARREHILARLLELPPSVRLVYRSELSRDEYNRHLARSRIVINVTVIGEINMRVYEACAAGSCLFVEDDNLDVPRMLEEDVSVVLYNEDNLVEKVLHYLGREPERQAVAAAGENSLTGTTYRANMNAILERLREIGPERLNAMGCEMRNASARDRLRHYLPANLRYSFGDTRSLRPLVRGLAKDPSPRDRLLMSLVDYALAVNRWREGGMVPLDSPELGNALQEMLRAAEDAPDDPSIGFALAAYARHHADPAGALRLFDRLLEQLAESTALPFAGTAFYAIAPNDDLRRRFERRAWESVEQGLPPGAALKGYLIDRVNQWKGELLFGEGRTRAAEDALRAGVAAAPAESLCRPLLAGLLGQSGQWDEVIPVCEAQLRFHPLDTQIRLVLVEALVQVGDLDGARQNLERLLRIHSVFGDEVGALQMEHMRRRLEQGRASARMAVGAPPG